MRRHRLVECGVEYHDLRQVRQNGAHGLDAGHIRRVVQRRQMTERAQRGDNRVIYPDRRSEPLSAVHHPVTGPDQMNAGVPGARHVFQHTRNDSLVTALGKPFFDRRRRKPLNPQHRLGRAEPVGYPREHALTSAGDQ